MKNFIPIDEIISIVKEELNSYFASGAIDDEMFPKWIELELKKLKKTNLPIKTVYLPIDNHTAELPEDFNSVRQLWSCESISRRVPSTGAIYYTKDCRITPLSHQPCAECEAQERACNCNVCDSDDKYIVTHRLTKEVLQEYKFSRLLRPRRSVINLCSKDCPNLTTDYNSYFDIRDCALYLEDIPQGGVHLEYYGNMTDEDGNILMEDNVFLKSYLILYLKYKAFETLSNSVNDESLNQLFQKMSFYKRESDLARLTMENEYKKLDVYQVSDLINQRRKTNIYYRRSLR